MKNGILSTLICLAIATAPAAALADRGSRYRSSTPSYGQTSRRGPDQTALRWHVVIDGQQVGPLNRDMIAAFVEAGVICQRTEVSTPGRARRGGEAFARLGEHPLFSDLAPDGHHADRGRGRGRGQGHGYGDRGRGHASRTNWAQQPAVIEACGDAFSGAANELACVQTVAWAPVDPTSLIDACEEAMEGDANELACLQTGVASSSPQLVSGLGACEEAMEGDANELACFKEVVKAPAWMDPAPTIAACERGMSGDAAELACIESGLAGPARRY